MAEPAAETAPEQPKASGGGFVGLPINGVGTCVLALAAVIIGGFVNGRLHAARQLIQSADGNRMLKPPPEQKQDDKSDHADRSGRPKRAMTFAFDPPPIVNLEDSRAVRFLQRQIEVLTRVEKFVEGVKLLQPVICNNVPRRMNWRDYKPLMTLAGTRALRVEDLYLTRFVVQ